MTKVEEPGLTRYSNMPVIEFEPTLEELKARRKTIKAINRADKRLNNIKERIEATNGKQQG